MSDEVGRASGLIRQGDVLLIPVDAVPGHGTIEHEETADRQVLAQGEATGHGHVAVGQALRLAQWSHSRRWAPPERRRYLFVDEAATVSHEEHLPIVIAPGIYEVRRQREYRPARSVWVAD
jgi:hypothetical protein